ncbi:MAG: hypothetical protein ACLSCQ_05440 [Evtepia gabavorous]
MPKEQKSANFQRLLQRQNEISWEKHQEVRGGHLPLSGGRPGDRRTPHRPDGRGAAGPSGGGPGVYRDPQNARITEASTRALFGDVVE